MLIVPSGTNELYSVSDIEMTTVLISGPTGFVGSNLSRGPKSDNKVLCVYYSARPACKRC
jgi:hypothetical protein